MKKVNFIARQNGGLLFDRKFSATELYIISTVRQRRLYESFLDSSWPKEDKKIGLIPNEFTDFELGSFF